MSEAYLDSADGAGTAPREELLRPEPKPEQSGSQHGGFALFGLMLAGFALFAIYVSSPVDLPEFPDCPIQSIGSCGRY